MVLNSELQFSSLLKVSNTKVIFIVIDIPSCSEQISRGTSANILNITHMSRRVRLIRVSFVQCAIQPKLYSEGEGEVVTIEFKFGH